MSKDLDFLSIQKKIILVMAHPDDEIIFANYPIHAITSEKRFKLFKLFG